MRVRAALAADGAGGSDEALAFWRDALARRQRLRSAWAERERDALYATLDEGYAPLPCLHAAARHAGTLPEELSRTVDELAERLAARVKQRERMAAGRKLKRRRAEEPPEPPPQEQAERAEPPPSEPPPSVAEAAAAAPAAATRPPPPRDEAREEAREGAREEARVEAELLRRDALRALRLGFAARCRTRRAARGGVLSCFAKWQFSLLRRSAAAAGAPSTDPLLPMPALGEAELSELRALLASELEEDGFAPADAAALASWLHGEWPKAAAKLAKRLDYLRREGGARPAAAPPPPRVVLRPHASKAGLVDVVHPGATLSLSQRRLQRLRALHGASSRAGAAEEEAAPAAEDRFLRSLLAMLLRYQALDGGGFQCAVPPPVFGCLKQLWGVSCEGFASPLNCSLDSYCSAFPDVDEAFGSSGSFFGAELLRGSYQLNPPFSAELYDALVQRCQRLLECAEAAASPLSYALIIGATAPALRLPCIAALRSSAHFRGELLVGVGEHVYVCGRQHMKHEPAIFRACDTGVFFLQTSAAAEAWPVTEPRLAQLRAAFEATNER